MASFKLIYLPKAPATSIITLGAKFSTYELWGGHIQFTIVFILACKMEILMPYIQWIFCENKIRLNIMKQSVNFQVLWQSWFLFFKLMVI